MSNWYHMIKRSAAVVWEPNRLLKDELRTISPSVSHAVPERVERAVEAYAPTREKLKRLLRSNTYPTRYRPEQTGANTPAFQTPGGKVISQKPTPVGEKALRLAHDIMRRAPTRPSSLRRALHGVGRGARTSAKVLALPALFGGGSTLYALANRPSRLQMLEEGDLGGEPASDTASASDDPTSASTNADAVDRLKDYLPAIGTGVAGAALLYLLTRKRDKDDEGRDRR